MENEDNNVEKSDPDAVKVPDSWLWIKGSDGKASVTTTFAAVSFFVVTVAYIFSMFESLGPIAFRPFDVAACTAYFAPILGIYYGRRHTESSERKAAKN